MLPAFCSRVEFLLIFRGLQFTTASRASLFIYTAPFFVALGSPLFLPGEQLAPAQWLGLVLSLRRACRRVRRAGRRRSIRASCSATS